MTDKNLKKHQKNLNKATELMKLVPKDIFDIVNIVVSSPTNVYSKKLNIFKEVIYDIYFYRKTDSKFFGKITIKLTDLVSPLIPKNNIRLK